MKDPFLLVCLVVSVVGEVVFGRMTLAPFIIVKTGPTALVLTGH